MRHPEEETQELFILSSHVFLQCGAQGRRGRVLLFDVASSLQEVELDQQPDRVPADQTGSGSVSSSHSGADSHLTPHMPKETPPPSPGQMPPLSISPALSVSPFRN